MNINAPYYKTAQKILVEKQGFTAHEAAELIKTTDRAELESAVMIYGSIHDAAFYMSKQLGLSDYDAMKFTREALGLDEKLDTTQLLAHGVSAITSIEDVDHEPLINQMVLDVCSKVHTGWGRRHTSDFFAKSAILDQQYKFLPIEFSGTQGLRDALLFVAPVVESIGLTINIETIELAYQEQVAMKLLNIQETGGIGLEDIGNMGIDTFVEIIEAMDQLNGFDEIAPEISYGLKKDAALILQVSDEIATKGLGADEALMSILQEKGILNREDPSGLDHEQ